MNRQKVRGGGGKSRLDLGVRGGGKKSMREGVVQRPRGREGGVVPEVRSDRFVVT